MIIGRNISRCRLLAVVSITAMALTCGSCELKQQVSQQEPKRSAKEPEKKEQVCFFIYQTLDFGGAMYAGTVESVKVLKIDPRGGPFGLYTEDGTIQFRVDKRLAGKEEKEVTIPFWWTVETASPALPMADWGGHRSAWNARPLPGERLLLLLGSADDHTWTPTWEGPAVCRWEVTEDDPLTKGFELVGEFIAAKGEQGKDKVLRRLCQSKLKNLRLYALNAAFSI